MQRVSRELQSYVHPENRGRTMRVCHKHPENTTRGLKHIHIALSVLEPQENMGDQL